MVWEAGVWLFSHKNNPFREFSQPFASAEEMGGGFCELFSSEITDFCTLLARVQEAVGKCIILGTVFCSPPRRREVGKGGPRVHILFFHTCA